MCSKSISILIPTHPGFVPHPPFFNTIIYCLFATTTETGTNRQGRGHLKTERSILTIVRERFSFRFLRSVPSLPVPASVSVPTCPSTTFLFVPMLFVTRGRSPQSPQTFNTLRSETDSVLLPTHPATLPFTALLMSLCSNLKTCGHAMKTNSTRCASFPLLWLR